MGTKQIADWASKLSDQELESEYYSTVYDSLGSEAEEMYERGYRETLKDMVREILEEKVEKAVQDVVHQTNMESLTYSEMRKAISDRATDVVRRAFHSVSVGIDIRTDRR